MQTHPQPGHPVAAIVAEAQQQSLICSHMLFDDPAYRAMLHKASALDQQILDTRSRDIKDLAAKIGLVHRMLEDDEWAAGDYVKSLLDGCLADCSALAG
jgi:hypothetical protein